MISDFIKMDFEEKSLVEFAENDLKELLDSDYYVEALRAASDLDFSYLLENGTLDGSGVVLNDRLIAEASLGLLPQAGIIGQNTNASVPPLTKVMGPIKNEHSYSLSEEPPKLVTEDELSDLENECFPAIPITEAEGSRIDTFNASRCSLENTEDSGIESSLNEPSNLLRHPSSETLSCCGDCCRPDEDLQLEDSIGFDMEELTENKVKVENSQSIASPAATESKFCHFPSSLSQSSSSISESSSVRYISLKNNTNEFKSTAPTILSTRTYHQQLPSSSSNNVVVTCSPDTPKSLPVLSSTLVKSSSETGPTPYSAGLSRQSSITSQAVERGFTYPPTPPSCSSSDSESQGDQSPLYEALGHHFCTKRKANGIKSTSRTPINTPLISSQPRGATGSLQLTDEEKRTLISEGYPVPSRLPLTKSEEKSLKKIRRKIKNKISAQESRRKKKEYMDTLEQKVDILVQENTECRRKVDSLQSKNSYLLQELQRLQNLVSRDEKNRSRSTVKAMIASC